jgi:hypothetical protein
VRLLWLPDALRDEGLPIAVVSGWKTRGTPEPFAPRGAMFHHTASGRQSGVAPSLSIVTHGRPDLPGPLCQVLVDRKGTAHVVASGRANHAGLGGPWRDIPLNSGNSFLVGVEVENDGVGEPWTETVLDACDAVFAAILKHLGRDASWCVGHKEYTSRKIDPSLDMGRYRDRLRRFMEDEMTDDQKKQLAEALAKARSADRKLTGVELRLGGKPEPLEAGPERWGWRFADKALAAGGPHGHEPSPPVPL